MEVKAISFPRAWKCIMCGKEAETVYQGSTFCLKCLQEFRDFKTAKTPPLRLG